jgi:hypothetical protein
MLDNKQNLYIQNSIHCTVLTSPSFTLSSELLFPTVHLEVPILKKKKKKKGKGTRKEEKKICCTTKY